MAISPGDPLVLMLEGRRAPYAGELLTLGRQSIEATRKQIREQAARVGFPIDPNRLGRNSEALSDEIFFGALGFSSTSSIDASDYERASLIHDLNSPVAPAAAEGRFDVVLDRGTSEHVFHLPNLLASLTRMVKPGGRIIHFVPSSNHIDHGFYMFSPTLFVDYYLANGFEIPTCWIVAHTTHRLRPCEEIYEYQPGCLDAVSHGGLDNRRYQLFCVAVRRTSATTQVVPQQRRYAVAWNAPAGSEGLKNRKFSAPQALRRLLRRIRRTVAGDVVLGALTSPIRRRMNLQRSVKRVYRHQL